MVLYLDIIVALAEDITVEKRSFLCLIIFAVGKQTGQLSCDTARKRNYALAVFLQDFDIDSRLVVKAFGIANRNKLYKVMITLVVFAEQYKVIRLSVQSRNFIEACSWCNINFAADNRLYPLRLCLIIKFDRSI